MSSETRSDDRLATLVHRLTRAFVNHETKEKSKVDFESLRRDDQGRVHYPEAYREAREKACSNAFLAIRGRRAEDFVEYFTGTICSVPQFLKEDEFLALSRALIDTPDTVKVLSMLALSAHSYLPTPKNTESPVKKESLYEPVRHSPHQHRAQRELSRRSAENCAVIQKITRGRFEYAIISPEAMRNAIRETLRVLGLPCNRERLHDEEQLAVKFLDYPDAERFADDFFMGWLVAAGQCADRKKIRDELKKNGRNPDHFTFKRDSVLRMNMAVALEAYRHDSVFTQSPQNVDSPWKNAESSQLLHRETAVTAFQYPFALNLEDCREKAGWTRVLLRAIGQLNDVAGNHARSYFEMAPASIVIRLTPQLVAGYDTYGFRIDDGGSHRLPEIVEGLKNGDYAGDEFYLGGKLVKDLDEAVRKELEDKKVTLDRSPQPFLETVAGKALPTAN